MENQDDISWLHVPEADTLPEDVQVLFGKFEEKTGFVPNVARIFALTPKHFIKWFKYYDFLMRTEESELSRKEREMVAVTVSSQNACEYCLASHSAYLREVSGDPALPDKLVHNYRRADLSKRERAVLDFAVALTNSSGEMTPENVQPLKNAGLSDAGILELAQVAAMFNFTNRLANALCWKPNEVYYHQHRTAKD